MTTTTFADYAAETQARQDIAAAALKHTYALCEALKHNYIQTAIRGHQKFVEDTDTQEYHQRKIDELKNGISPVDFKVETGRKYHKVVFYDGGGQRSCHAFVDTKTGEVYKSASWKAPAKGVRYDLRLIKDREWLFENADWSGGYLYAK
jgi:hypothetical protein